MTKESAISTADLKAMARAIDIAQEEDEPVLWDAAAATIVPLLQACATADDVARVLRAHRGIFEDARSLYPCPQAVDILFARIATMDGKDAGLTLGWLSRASAPLQLVMHPARYPGLRDHEKDYARAAVEAHIDTLREWIANVSAEWRSGVLWDAAAATIVPLLQACATADDVARVLRAHRGIFEDARSLYPCPQAVDILFARIATMDGKDAGLTLGWLSRASAPLQLVMHPARYPGLRDHEKDYARAAVEAHIDTLREWIANVSAEWRSGAMYLLALCTNSKSQDARALMAGAEKDRTAAATAILAAGVILARSNDEAARASCKAAAEAKLADKNALTRLCAAASLALVSESVSEAAVNAIAAHVAEPVAIPAPWGWIAERAPQPRSDAFALAILSWIRTDSPDAAIDVLLPKPLAKLSRDAAGAVRDALMHLGLEAKRSPMPRPRGQRA